jgi:hypothetical protein
LGLTRLRIYLESLPTTLNREPTPALWTILTPNLLTN